MVSSLVITGEKRYTLELVRAIKEGDVSFPLDSLIDYAARNKILLQFLRSMNIDGMVRNREERRYKIFLDSLAEINQVLARGNYDYAFFKLYKPVLYVPADIDILVSSRDVGNVAKELLRRGFNIEVFEPYTLTLTRGSIIVDLYTFPSMGNIVYLDGQRLLEYRKIISVGGVEIPSLAEHVEVVVSLCHAIDKEWLYTLNDYFTVSEWFDRRSLDLCYELGCVFEARLALTLNKLIEEGLVEAPVKIPNVYRLMVWGNKMFSNDLCRASVLRSVFWLRDRRLGKAILTKLVRETY